MKMRGKMVDGSPVTFEWIDLGGLCYADTRTGKKSYGSPWITDFVGEGFFVRSVWDGQPVSYGPHDQVGLWRLAFDRQSLERAGVDTATVERKGRWIAGWGKDRCDVEWEKIWPTVTRFDDPSFTDRVTQPLVDKIHDLLVTTPMVHAGAATLHDVVQSLVAVDKGQLYVTNPHRAVTLIWRAMVAAWQRGG